MLDKHYVTLYIHWQLPAGKNLIPVMSCKSRSTFTGAARNPLDMKQYQHAWSVGCVTKLAPVEGRSLQEYRKQERSCLSPLIFPKFSLVLYSSYAAYHQPWPVKCRRKMNWLTLNAFLCVWYPKLHSKLYLKNVGHSSNDLSFPHPSKWPNDTSV